MLRGIRVRMPDIAVYVSFVLIYLAFFGDAVLTPQLIYTTDLQMPPLALSFSLPCWSPNYLGAFYPFFSWWWDFVHPLLFSISFGNRVVAQRLMISHILVACFTMYLFLGRLTKSRLAGFAGSILYAYNPVILHNFGTLMLWGFALSPLVFHFYIKVLKGKARMRDAVLLGLSLTFTVEAMRHAVILLPPVLLVFLLVYVWVGESRIRLALGYLKPLLISIAIFLATSTQTWRGLFQFFLSPYTYAIPGWRQLSDFSFLYSDFTLPNGIRLAAMSGERLFQDNPIGFIPPALAFSAVLLVRNRGKKQDVLSFSIASILLTLFGLSVKTESAWFLWLYERLPPLSILRGPHSTILLMCLTYASLTAVAVDDLHHRLLRWRFEPSLGASSPYLAVVLLGALVFLPYFAYSPAYKRSEHFFYPSPPAYGGIMEWLGGRVEIESWQFRYLVAPFTLATTCHLGPTYSARARMEPTLFQAEAEYAMPQAFSYVIFAEDALVENRTNLAAVLSPVGVRYLFVNFGDVERDFWGGEYFRGSPFRFGTMLKGDPGEYSAILQGMRELKKVYVGDHFAVYENEMALPRVSVFGSAVLIFGGRDALETMSQLPGFDIHDSVLIFAEQAPELIEDLIKKSSLLVLHDRDVADIWMALATPRFGIDLWEFGEENVGLDLGTWARERLHPYDFSYGRGYVETGPRRPLRARFTCGADGIYEIWIRAYHDKKVGGIAFSLDGVPLDQELVPRADRRIGFKWMRLGSYHLGEGEHELTVRNTDEFAAVDELVVIPSAEMRKVEDRAKGMIRDVDHVAIIHHIRELLPTSRRVLIPREGDYTAALYAKPVSVGSSVGLKVDGNWVGEVRVTEPGWHELGPVRLGHGEHELSFSGKAILDRLVLHSASRLVDLFPREPVGKEWSAEKVSETRYEVEIRCDRPVFVVLGESYHPTWSALAEGKELTHFPAFSLTNGFYLDAEGTHHVVIQFEMQGTYEIITSSVIGIFTGSVALVAYDLASEPRRKAKDAVKKVVR